MLAEVSKAFVTRQVEATHEVSVVMRRLYSSALPLSSGIRNTVAMNFYEENGRKQSDRRPEGEPGYQGTNYKRTGGSYCTAEVKQKVLRRCTGCRWICF